jgi:hypothetical protein
VQQWTAKAGSQQLSLHLRSPATAQAAAAAESAAALAALAAEQQVLPTAWREYVVQQVSCFCCSVIIAILLKHPLRP